jgi:hypothetical protein
MYQESQKSTGRSSLLVFLKVLGLVALLYLISGAFAGTYAALYTFVAYGTFALLAWRLIRREITEYRYILKGNVLSIERILGRRAALLASIELTDVQLSPYEGKKGVKTDVFSTLSPKKGGYALEFIPEGSKDPQRIVFHPSRELLERLRRCMETTTQKDGKQ